MVFTYNKYILVYNGEYVNTTTVREIKMNKEAAIEKKDYKINAMHKIKTHITCNIYYIYINIIG